MKKMRLTTMMVLAITGMTVAPMPTASGVMATECAGVDTYFNWECGQHGGEDGFSQILLTVYNWMAAAVSIGVIIGILFGAIMYASAGGNEAQTKNAIAAIRNSVIALVLFFLMWSFLNFVTPGGFFAG